MEWCEDSPTAFVLENYIDDNPEEPFSASITTTKGQAVQIKYNDQVIEYALEGNVGKRKELGNIDLLEDFTKNELVYVDPITLTRVLGWVNRPECPEGYYRTVPLTNIDNSIIDRIDGATKDKLDRLGKAKLFLLDALGGTEVLLALQDEVMEDYIWSLDEEEKPYRLFTNPKADPRTIVRITVELLRIMRGYIRQYSI